MTAQAQMQQLRRNTIVQEAQRRNYPPTLTQQELYTKITTACTEVGIDDILIREWQKNTYGTEMTDGVIRQQKYDSNYFSNCRILQDIAYLVDESRHPRGTYNVDMVHVNFNIFSDGKAQQFSQALIQQGLHPNRYQSYARSGFGISHEEILQKEARRKHNIIYK